MAEKRVTVINALNQIVAVNIKRTGLVIYNNGPSAISWSRDKLGAIGEGFILPTGAVFSWAKVDGDDSWNAVYGLSIAAGADLSVTESVEELPADKLLKLLEARG